jgi:hypothetical protein
MRDVIWTLIIIWVVYKIIDVFKNTKQKSFSNNQSFNSYKTTQSENAKNYSTKKEPKVNVKKNIDKEGDYIDFEEIN